MLGDNIKKYRIKARLGLNEAANIVGISAPYLSTIENNKRINPSTQVLQKIADALGVSVEDFFKEDGVPLDDTEKEIEQMHDFENAEEALSFILKQPSLMAFGGYDLKQMSNEEIIEIANDMLFAMRLSIEKMKKKNK